LNQCGAQSEHIAGALLTHTHSDHVKKASLTWLARHGIPLYCHDGHLQSLRRWPEVHVLEGKGLLRIYDDRPWIGPLGMRIEAFPVSHDDGATHGFRIELRVKRSQKVRALGYMADSGIWTEAHAEVLADVDVLAVEFNHDVELQRASGRPFHLIDRVLGDKGHLSNEQGAALVCEVLARSRRGTVHSLVLLHLSEQCNRPELALAAANQALRSSGRRFEAHVAAQHHVSACVTIDGKHISRSGLCPTRSVCL
jgi:phosphoribosyl 1,2-cyclic phosphodiesterase